MKKIFRVLIFLLISACSKQTPITFSIPPRVVAAETVVPIETIPTVVPTPEPHFIDVMFENNPIDAYFIEMSIVYDSSTAGMARYGYIGCSAWEAEMLNCYEILADIAVNEQVIECIRNEMNSYIEYVRNHVELNLYYDYTDAFFGSEMPWGGTIIRMIRPVETEGMYRQKTLELFYRLNGIGIIPEFIFSREVYDEQLQQAYPDRWAELFGAP
jgi:hypothetical protein